MIILEKNRVKILGLVFLLSFMGQAYAQNYNLDSLNQILLSTENDSVRASVLFQLAIAVELTDKEQAIKYATKALEFETDITNRGKIYNSIGFYNWQLGNIEKSLNFYKEAYDIFNDLNDSSWTGRIANNIGSANWGLGNSNEALEYYQIALSVREKINDLSGVSLVSNNIGLIYQDWGLYDEALTWHNNALTVALEIKSTGVIVYSYSNIGKCYENKNVLKLALQYYNLGYKELLEKDPKSRSFSFILASIGDVQSKMGNFSDALVTFEASLEEAIKINNKNRIAIAEHGLGKAYLALNNLEQAEKYILSSYKTSKQNGYSEHIKNNEFVLSQIEEKRGNISKAFMYFKSASALKDSTFNEQKIAKFTELQMKYFSEQQSKENIILRKNNEIQQLIIDEQKNIRTGLIIIGIFVLVMLVVITRSRSSIKKLNLKLLKSEKELLAINDNKDKFFSIISHDLKSPFGGLLGITQMLEEDFDELSKNEIKDMIRIIKHSSTNIYELLDGLLQWAQAQSGGIDYNFGKIDLLNISSEVIQLNKLTASNKKISIINNIERETFAYADELSVKTILRNLITNSIKFTNENGKIVADAIINNNKVYVSISDTGVGISQNDLVKLFKIENRQTTAGTNKEVGTGLGLLLCKELVEKNGGEIWAESEVGKGSKFVFTLPLDEINKEKDAREIA